MDIGTGLFLGLALLGFVWLYVATRDRWKWKRIAALAGGLLALPVVGVLLWAGYVKLHDSRPRLQTELWDLKPGMPQSEVLFRKGEPKKRDGHSWFYSEGDGPYHIVAFEEDGRVRFIAEGASEERSYLLSSVQEIGSFSTQQDVEAKFGAPSDMSVSEDGSQRLLSYPKYGLAFELYRNKVRTGFVMAANGRPIRYTRELKEGHSPSSAASAASGT